jgi:hypothetical protein
MALIAVIFGLLIGVFAISLFIAYWVIMAMIVLVGAVFVLLAMFCSSYFQVDTVTGSIYALVACGITFWIFSALGGIKIFKKSP